MPFIVATTSYNDHAVNNNFEAVSNPIPATDHRTWGDVYQGQDFAADVLDLTRLINHDLDTQAPPPVVNDLLAARLNNWTGQ